MPNRENVIFSELFQEFLFTFQIECASLLVVKQNQSNTQNLYEKFHFEVHTEYGKPVAVYEAKPCESEITLERNLGISEELQKKVKKSFERLFKKVQFKTAFA